MRSIAAKTNAFLTLVNGPEILSAYLGESEQALRNVFDEAIKNAKKETSRPVLIFIDEVDSICQARDEKDTGNEGRIVTQLCTLFDKIALMRKQRVVVIGATNRPNTIDNSLRRPGALFGFPLFAEHKLSKTFMSSTISRYLCCNSV